MIRRPPRSTRTDTLFPYTTLFRSKDIYHITSIKPRAAAYHPSDSRFRLKAQTLRFSRRAAFASRKRGYGRNCPWRAARGCRAVPRVDARAGGRSGGTHNDPKRRTTRRVRRSEEQRGGNAGGGRGRTQL